MLTQARLKELLHYDPETGIFTRLAATNNRSKVGEIVGNKTRHGYLQSRVDKSMTLLHRLAFLYMEGSIPPFVDHINRNRVDNRWKNLRPATPKLNSANVRQYSTNKSGHPNVCWHKAAKKWRAEICSAGKHHHLGLFTDKNEAIAVAQKAKTNLHPPLFNGA